MLMNIPLPTSKLSNRIPDQTFFACGLARTSAVNWMWVPESTQEKNYNLWWLSIGNVQSLVLLAALPGRTLEDDTRQSYDYD